MPNAANPGAPGAGPAPPWEPAALLGGVLALAAWAPVLGGAEATGAAALVLSMGLAGGVMGFASMVLRSRALSPDDGVLAALLGFLGWPVLFRRGVTLLGGHISSSLAHGLLLEASAVTLGLCLLWLLSALPRKRTPWLDPVLALGAVGWGGTVGAFLLVLLGLGTPRAGGGTVIVLSMGLVTLALIVQRATAWKANDPRITALGSAPALVVAGSQLLDGVVSYLAVNDPLGVLAGRFQEEVLLSAAILEATGPGYPIAKWAVALTFTYYMDGYHPEAKRSLSRLAAYLLVGLLGMGPALFSTTQLAI